MENTVIERLEALAALQTIDSRLYRIRNIRGGLPEEVSDLEDEIEGLRTRLDDLTDRVEDYRRENTRRNLTIDESSALINKYKSQIMEVKNNREYDSLNREITMADLEIKTNQKKINENRYEIEKLQEEIDLTTLKYNERVKYLDEKNKELDKIVRETEAEERELLKQSEEAQKRIESRILRSYLRIRNNMRNGLAVVTMDRAACGGCFAIIPPQRSAEIRQKRKLIVCENCGRILVDQSIFDKVTGKVAEAAEAEPAEA